MVLPRGSVLAVTSPLCAAFPLAKEVLTAATLQHPGWPADAPPSGRLGRHGPELTELLDELQGLARKHPEATW